MVILELILEVDCSAREVLPFYGPNLYMPEAREIMVSTLDILFEGPGVV